VGNVRPSPSPIHSFERLDELVFQPWGYLPISHYKERLDRAI
jgi:hypothetical protein